MLAMLDAIILAITDFLPCRKSALRLCEPVNHSSLQNPI